MDIRKKIDKSLEMDHEGILRKYSDDPIRFCIEVGKRKYPPKHRELYNDVISGEVTKGMAVANRGGGKTVLFGDLASSLYLFKKFDAFVLGGSEGQSRKCYEYASQLLRIPLELDDFNAEQGKTITKSVYGNWMAIGAASMNSVRGPHCGDPHPEMDMKQHGGILIKDEECEMKDEISDAADYCVNTAEPDIILRGSTQHKVTGRFVEALENAEEMGYKVYRWDCFDTTRGCDRDCRTCREDFAGNRNKNFTEWKKFHPEFIWEEGYCEGKAKKGGGWRRIWGAGQMSTIEGSFQLANSRELFEIEEIGRQPQKGGRVLNADLLRNCVKPGRELILGGGVPSIFEIDWGYDDTTTIIILQKYDNFHYYIAHVEYYHKTLLSVIMERLKGLRDRFGAHIVCADASHPFNNAEIANCGFTVMEVEFAKYKDLGVGWIIGMTESKQLWIPGTFNGKELIFPNEHYKRIYFEMKGWKRNKMGKVVKMFDHGPDALLCGSIIWGKNVPWKAEFEAFGNRDSLANKY